MIVRGGPGYVAGPDREAKLRVADNEAGVGVFVSRPRIPEVTSVKDGEGAEIIFLRGGDLSRSLKVPFATSGTATPGTDYTKLKSSVTFKAGSDRASLRVAAGRDGRVESDESLVVTLLPARTHAAKKGAESAQLTIEDLSNSVRLVEVLRSGIRTSLLLERTHPLDFGQSVAVLERRIYADGSTREFRRRVTFPKGRNEGLVSIPGDKQDVRIEFSLIDDGSFIPQGVATLVYE